jgi:hypothetical protein
MYLALARAIRARRELYVYSISDVKFLGYVVTIFVMIFLKFCLKFPHYDEGKATQLFLEQHPLTEANHYYLVPV